MTRWIPHPVADQPRAEPILSVLQRERDAALTQVRELESQLTESRRQRDEAIRLVGDWEVADDGRRVMSESDAALAERERIVAWLRAEAGRHDAWTPENSLRHAIAEDIEEGAHVVRVAVLP